MKCIDGLLWVSLYSICLFPGIARADFSFTITCDTRSYTAPGQFDAVLQHINATGGPGVFMICPGDMDPPDVIDTQIRNAFGPTFPWYNAIGNHEAETPSDMIWMRNVFLNLPYIVQAGPPNGEETTYSFDYGNAHFVVLNQYYNGLSDVGTDGDVVPALYNWLNADLATSTKSWKFVIGHEPAYPQCDTDWGDCRHIGDSLDQYPAHRDAFWALLDSHNVVAYLVGHTHRYSRYFKDGVWQVDTAQARGTDIYDTYLRVFVSDYTITFHTYRSLYNGIFNMTDSWTVNWAPVAPIIAEVTPDPDSVKTTVEYQRQLSLLQGFPSPSWSVVTGPSGTAVDENGLVHGWVPDPTQLENTYSITIQADNAAGSDQESWQVKVVSLADFDLDEDVDLQDFGLLQKCYSGTNIPYSTGCQPADLDQDNDVDQLDFGKFKNCMRGTNNLPGC